MSARSHATCGMVGDHTLAIVGGMGPHGPVGHDDATSLTITRGDAETLAAEIIPKGDRHLDFLTKIKPVAVLLRLTVPQKLTASSGL